VSQLLAKGGLERRAVTPAEMKAIEPTLSGTFYGGYFTESDSTGDIHSSPAALPPPASDWACNAATVRNRVGGQQWQAGQRDRAPGSGNRDLDLRRHGGLRGHGQPRPAAQLGDSVNIYPVKGYSITVNLPDEASRAAAPW
jgi:D-amino-acid dehydrogenase